MANWNLPTVNSGYINFVTEMNDKFFDNARMHYVGSINMPQGTMRFNRSSYVFDEWDAANGIWLPRVIGIAGGGTGATTPAGIVANLGLGSMSTQNNNAVNITGGTITGVVLDISSATGILPLARGGTGASLAIGANNTVMLAYNGVVQFATGLAITELNANYLSAGVVPDARIAANIPRLSTANVWTEANDFHRWAFFTGPSAQYSCVVYDTYPTFNFWSPPAPAGRKSMRTYMMADGRYNIQKTDDAYTYATDLFWVDTAGVLAGNGYSLYGLYANNLFSGTVPIGRLGTNPGAASAGTFLRGDNTWAAVATGGEVSPIPSGLVAIFDSACPAGWTRFTQLDGRFPLGATSPGAYGGSNTHSHGFDVTSSNAGGHAHSFGGSFGGSGTGNVSGNTAGASQSRNVQYDPGGSNFDYTPNHDHFFSDDVTINVNINVSGDTSGVGDHAHRVAGGTDGRDHTPFYYSVVFCRKD